MAPQRLAAGGRGRRRAGAAAGGVARPRPARRCGSVARRPRRRGPRTRSTRSASSRPAGWRRASPVHEHSPTAYRPGSVARAVEVGGDPAHHVVRRRRDRAPARARGRSRRGAAPRRRSGTAPGRPRACRGSTDVAPVSAICALDRARHLVARRELVDEPLARGVEQPRALAADRLGDEEPVRAVRARRRRSDGTAPARGRRASRPARERQQQPAADGPDRVGRARPQRRRAAGGEHRRRARDPARRRRARRPGSGRSPASSADRAPALEHLDPRRARRPARSAGGSAAARSRRRRRGRSAAPSGRPRARARAARAGRRRTTPRADCRSSTAPGASSHRTRAADSRTAPRPAAIVSARWQLGAVVGRRARRRARPGPSRSRTRRAASPRSSVTRAPSRAAQMRRVQPGGAGADDGNLSLERLQWQVRYSRWRSVFLEHPSSLEHDTGAHPEQAGADRRDRARARARATGSGSSGSQSPAVDRDGADRGPPRGLRRSRSSGCRRAAAARSTSTRSPARARSRPRCTPPAAPSRMVELLLDGEADVRVQRPPAARPPRARRPARWASACSTTSRSRRAFALERRGLERVMILDWDVHHGNGTNDIFHASDRGAVRLDPPVAAVPGDRRRRRRRGRATGEGFTVNLPVPPGTGRRRVTVARRPRRGAAGARVRAAARADLGRLRRPPRRSARGVRGDRGRLRRDDALDPRAWRTRSRRRSAACSRAATRWGRSAASVAATMSELAPGRPTVPTQVASSPWRRGARAA